jgi:multiple antibiotic resistance protein
MTNFVLFKFGVMNFNLKEIFTAFMVLFAVIDIIGNIPIIIDLRKKAGHIQSGKASFIAGFIMILFLFLGQSLLKLIGIDVNSFAVAGSFILFFIALEMILGITLYKDNGDANAITASIFPLAFPLIAGPGSLTTLLSLRAEFYIENIIAAVLLNVVLIYIVLKTSKKIEKLIGPNGIQIIRKIFGVILLAIAVKLFAANIKMLFN